METLLAATVITASVVANFTPAAFARPTRTQLPCPTRHLLSALRAASSKPATAPTRHLIRITVPLPDSTESITAFVDVSGAPQFKKWGINAARYALKWYPELARRLPSPGYTPPRQFTLVIRPADGVASTSGSTITINTGYLKDHTDDMGMVAHELVHVIQHYRGRGNPGWLVEGIADYLRYFVVEPGAKNAHFDPDRSSYKRGYQPAAAMLNWLELKKGPGIIARLNQVMRQGKYKPGTFKKITGYQPDQLWHDFKASLVQKS